MNLKNTLKIFISLILIYFLIKYNSLDLSVITKLDFIILIKLFILFIFILIFGSLKWYFILKVQNKNINYKETFEAYYIGYALNYYLFGVAGDLIKTFFIAKKKSNKTGIVLSVLLDRFLGMICMLVIILFFIPNVFKEAVILKEFFVNYTTFYYIFLCSTIFLFLYFFYKFLNSRRINKLLTYNTKNKIILILIKILNTFLFYKSSYLNILINMIFSIVIQFFIALSLFLISLSIINEDLSFVSHILSSVSVQVLTILPISPGNIGVSEVAYAQLMQIMNENKFLPFASVYFIYRIFSMLVSIPGFFIYYIYLRRDAKNEK